MTEEDFVERPFECSECKKSAKIVYKEVIGNTVTVMHMCESCPALHKKLYGIKRISLDDSKAVEGKATKTCNLCGTTLEAIRMGSPLGCKECYVAFEEEIIHELVQTRRLILRQPLKEGKERKIHVGRGPGETSKINPSLHLVALNETMKEALEREDYEEAAWLRDQINKLVKQQDQEDDKAR